MSERMKSISAIWAEKDKKTVAECAKAICDFLILLRDHNSDLFDSWYQKGYTQRDAMGRKIVLTESYFKGELEKKGNKKHIDLGTTVSYWNGSESDGLAVAISFTIGGYGDKSFNINSCVINLPSEGNYYESAENQELLKKLIVKYWRPSSVLVNGEPVPA